MTSSPLEDSDLHHFLTAGPILDVRSPGEFRQGHLPGAYNLPLLDDAQRAEIGKAYKAHGQVEAVRLGFERVGPDFHKIISQAEAIAPQKRLYLYCARGGLRSEIVEWLLQKGGFSATRIRGGYKRLRHRLLKVLEQPYPFVILSGPTGAGKTELLERARCDHHLQTIDLEALARHKGSVFGGLGQDEQPSDEHFENCLAARLLSLDPQQPVLVEDESRLIGKVKIPDPIFERMRVAPWIDLNIEHQRRLHRILDEYGNFSIEALAQASRKLRKRLGDLRLRQSLEALEAGDLFTWAGYLLEYYDRAYHHAQSKRDRPPLFCLDGQQQPMQEIATQLTRQLRQASLSA
jgi:tRNA 2-selenouridine synthase